MLAYRPCSADIEDVNKNPLRSKKLFEIKTPSLRLRRHQPPSAAPHLGTKNDYTRKSARLTANCHLVGV